MNVLPLAERATLGALLLDPAVVPTISAWLRAADFTDPWHREVYKTLRELHASEGGCGPTEVGLHLLDRLGPTRADLPRVLALLKAVPAAPDPRVYAVMVLEAALRHEVTGLGVLLRAGAVVAAGDGTAHAMAAATSTVDTLLDTAEARWEAATSKRAPSRLGAARTTATTDRCIAADRFLQAHPPVPASEVAEHEATLIAALLTHPDHLHATACWLRPAAVTSDAWRPVYEAMLHLHTYGRPIDAVSVLWEAQRSTPRTGAGPDPATVMSRVEGSLATSPGYWGRVVAADHLRLAADHAAQSLCTAADNPGLALAEVLGTGHVLTEALRTAARPLGTPDRARVPLASVHALPVPQTHRSGPVAG